MAYVNYILDICHLPSYTERRKQISYGEVDIIPRPRKCRKVCQLPRIQEFHPLGPPPCGPAVVLNVDEYEAIRLIDRQGFSQEECSAYMQVARTTVQMIYNSARKKLAAALDSFRGETQQVPSMYSALKYQGKKLYEYARQGIEVPREARPITVYELLFIRREGDELELEIHCSKGTYIRTIIDDLGEKLGCGAHVIFLRRLAVSKYPVERMVTLEQLQALVDEAAAQDIPAAQLLDPLLMPMDSPASDYPLVNIPETSAVYFKNGNPVRQSGAPLNGLVRVMESESGKFLGMGEIDDEGRVAPRRLVVEYPA